MQREHHQISLRFESGELAVRDALAKVRVALSEMELSKDDIGSVEIVLGEVLNNVVEHAYAGDGRGDVSLGISRSGHVLRFQVSDCGVGLPLGRLPNGRLPPLDGPLEALPEGGFGWYLVQNLACDLTYRREHGRNMLAFSILCGAGQ